METLYVVVPSNTRASRRGNTGGANVILHYWV